MLYLTGANVWKYKSIEDSISVLSDELERFENLFSHVNGVLENSRSAKAVA